MESKQIILKLYKNRGETPLECLERFKKDNPEYKNEKMTYAGRLDPLAEGLLLVLVGEECKNKDKYLGLDKTYEVDVLFGFSTDTYDVLGKVTKSANDFVIPVETGIHSSDSNLICSGMDSRLRGNDTTRDIILSFAGKFSQKYPPFSSKTIRGKSLFSLFKSGELKDDEIPVKDVEIKDIKIIGEKSISKNDLEKYIIESIGLVKGDFRQKEILDIWKSIFDGLIRTNERMINNINNQEFKIISLRVDCTSGTYMRSLANSIGEKVGIPALALNIKRIKIANS